MSLHHQYYIPAKLQQHIDAREEAEEAARQFLAAEDKRREDTKQRRIIPTIQ